MSKLHISLQKLLDVPADQPTQLRGGVVASVYPVGKAAGLDAARRRALRDLVVPFELGDANRRLEVDVAAGEYFVEATLPSGQVVSQEVEVREGESLPVILQAPESPHEWLSWHHLQGRLPRTATAYEKRRLAIAATKIVPAASPVAAASRAGSMGPSSVAPSAARTVDEEVRVGVLSVLVGEAPADSWRAIVPDPGRLDAALSKDNIARARPPEVLRKQRAHSIAEFEHGDDATRHFLFRSDTPAVSASLAALHGVIPGDWRRYVRLFCAIRHRGRTLVCALPVPWITATGQETAVDVAATLAAPSLLREGPRALQPMVAVRDSQFGTLLGYLGRGDLRAAASIVATAKGYLEDKMSNPFAAAAGAYVLLETLGDASERRPEWMHWIGNLMNFFQHIPDGAVLQGWLKLKGRGTDKELAEARASLLEAFGRGMPYFSVGLRLLVDGLTLFANDAQAENRRDANVESALEIARWFAMRTDMRQPFTTVELPREP